MKLLPFQQVAVDIMANRRHTLLADEMGLGKTPMCIELINKLQLDYILIVCPASVKLNWLRELNAWLKIGKKIQIVSKKSEDIDIFAQVVIVNYDLIVHSNIHGQLMDQKFDLLICDEAHYLKNMKAKRTTAVLASNGLVHRAKRTIMVTGTPILNRPIELYPILKVLSPQTIAPYTNYYTYGRRFCGGYRNGFEFDVSGASHTDDLNKRLKAGYMIRRLVKDVHKELPPKRYEIFFLEQTAGVKGALVKIEEAQRKDFKHQDLNLDGGQIATERRETAEAKLDQCLEHIHTMVESSGKLVIFAYHHSVIDRLMGELKEYNPVMLRGGMNATVKQEAIDTFQNDPRCHVFIGQIQAAGQGIDGLQRICSNVLFIEWSWVPGEVEQAIKRVHRMGQDNPVLVQFIVWADSIEEHQMRIALDKVKTIKEIMV